MRKVTVAHAGPDEPMSRGFLTAPSLMSLEASGPSPCKEHAVLGGSRSKGPSAGVLISRRDMLQKAERPFDDLSAASTRQRVFTIDH
jgi:hypothetical protein